MNYDKDELITALNIDELSTELQDQVLASFLDTLEMRTGQAISDTLTDEQLEQFNKLVDEQGDEAAENWLKQTIPDFDGIEQQQADLLIAELVERGNSITG